MKGRRIDKCLINPTEKERLEREPLLKFSHYLSDRNNIIISLLDEIIELLDKGFKSDSVDGIKIGEASTKMWFWTLGAYEILRTMSQAKICFEDEFLSKIDIMKRKLAIVRMPSAKMEKARKNEAVNSNRSPDGWNNKDKDLLIGDPENSISARLLLKEYDDLMTKLKPENILKRHEEQYRKDKKS